MGKKDIIKYIATILLVLMTTQYIPLEGQTISLIKFGAMCCTPFLWLMFSPKFSSAFIWGGLYLLVVILSAYCNYDSFRGSTLIYLSAFVFMFITFYNLIHCEGAFSIDYFIRLLKWLILAYTLVLLMQQSMIILGIKTLPLINLVSPLNRGIGANSLSIEPSHAARILTVLFLSLLRMYEVKFGKENVDLRLIWENSKSVVLGFLWSMLTMGSGTAFIGLGVLSLYFIKRQYALTILPLIILLYFAAPYIDFQPLQRARVVFDAAITLDQSAVIKADGSAAHRVVPLINTLTELDLTDSQTWFGRGVDNGGANIHAYSNQSTIGGISSYGLFSYIFALLLLFNCIIYRVLSLEFIVCFVLIGLSLNNFAYTWGIYMFIAASRYFQEGYKTEKHD